MRCCRTSRSVPAVLPSDCMLAARSVGRATNPTQRGKSDLMQIGKVFPAFRKTATTPAARPELA